MATYFEYTDGYNSYAGTDVVVTAQLSYLGNDKLSKKCYILGSLQTISISTHQDKRPVRRIGSINAIDYVMGQRTIAGSLVFAVFDRHFADEIFKDLKSYTSDVTILTDEIPPLDLTINFANEYGKKSKMALYGVKIINEGQVMSINDLYTENTYQFVALGMEPLVSENVEYVGLDSSSKKEKKSNNDNKKKNTTKKDTLSGIKKSLISLNIPKIKNNTSDKTNKGSSDEDISNKKLVDFYYRINQPIVEKGNGIINFNVDNEYCTNIYILDKTNNKQIVLNKDNISINGWSIELPEGEYSIRYINTEDNEYSNWENISIKYNKSNNVKKDYIITDYITDNSLYLESNNSNYNKLIIEDCNTNENKMNIYSLNSDSKIISIIKNKIYISNLKNNNLYKIYMQNDISESNPIYIKTLSKKNEDLLMLIEYIKYNKKLWINDFNKFNFDNLYNDGITLIDKVLNLEDNCYKQELLLYAIKLQNELLYTFNNSCDINKLYNSNLLNINLNSDLAFNKINIYQAINNNEYYKYTLNNSEDKFIGISNKRYTYQAIDENNSKSVKYNYCFLDNNYKQELYAYNNLNNLNKLNFEKYQNQYINFDENLIKAIIAKDNNTPNIYILNGPDYTYNDLLEVDLNYKDYLQNTEYYLCIATIYDALDYIPIRKIKFYKDDISLKIENYKSGIIKNNYYLLWIENNNFEIISDSTILSSYTNTVNLEKYKSIYVKNYLNVIIKILSDKLSCNDLLNSIYFSIYSYNPLPKNITHLFGQELINEGYNSLYSNNLDYILYTFIELFFSDTKKMCNKVIIKDNTVNFINPVNCKVVSFDYYLNNDTPTINDYSNFNIDISYKGSLYTVLYLIEDNMIDKSGFILINNETNKFYNYNIEIEVK